MKFSPAIRYASARWVGFTPPAYEPTFVEEFKRVVRIHAWDAWSKTWWFHEGDLEATLSLASVYWHVDRTDFPVVAPGKVPIGKISPYSILGVDKNAPDSVVEGAYRALRTDLIDGSPEPLWELEEAYEQIQRQRR